MTTTQSTIPTLAAFRANALAFLDRCGVSDGVFGESAWEAAGCPNVTSPEAAAFVRPAERRSVVVRTLGDRMRTGDWAFASTPGGVESLEAGHSAVEALFFHGQLQRLTPDHRAAWVDYFNQYHDEATGYYLGPCVPPRDHPTWHDPKLCSHPWDHMHDHLVSCLCPTLTLLGGRARHKLSHGSQTGRFLDREYLRHYLRGRDWTGYRRDGDYRRQSPWYLGNEYWYPARILWQITQWEPGTAEARAARLLLDEEWYGWHDTNFHACGSWIGDLTPGSDPARRWHGPLQPGQSPTRFDDDTGRRFAANPLLGGCHQLWFYDFDGHPIPDAIRRAQTDVCLALQNRHHRHFGRGDVDHPTAWSNNCSDVDCTTILAINHHRQDYRRAEIEQALERNARAILTHKLNDAGVLESIPGQPWSHNFNSVATFSPADAGNVHNQSFYLWALLASFSVVRRSDDPALQGFLDHPWPRVPTHWLHVPPLQ